jgi:hypothetical protein
MDELNDFDLFRVLMNYFRFEQIEVDNLDLDSKIDTGARLFKPDGYTIGSLPNHKQGNRCNYFVRMCIDVDVDRRAGRQIKLEKRIFFGDAITYFRIKLENDTPRLLALVRVYAVEKDELSIWPCKNLSAEMKYRVISVHTIMHLCARSIDKDGKDHIYWEPEKCTNHSREKY